MSTHALPVRHPGSAFSIRGVADLIGRALAVGIGYAVVTVVAGLVVGLLGLPLPAIAQQVDPQTSLALRLAGGSLLALVLGPLSRRLDVPLGERIGVLFLALLVVNGLVNLIEALYFTTFFENGAASTILMTALLAAGLASLIGVLFAPRTTDRRLGVALRDLLAARRPRSWAWRAVLASLLYFPTYFAFGLLVYPFVRTYYEDPTFGAGVLVPSFEVIVPLEIVRGALYVLAVFPLVALLSGSRWRLALWLGLVIAALNAWEPLLTNTLWPVTMRVAHGLEITGDAIVQGLTIAWLLGVSGTSGLGRSDPPGRR